MRQGKGLLTFAMLSCFLVIALLRPPVLLSTERAQFYVAPHGRADGNGSKVRPWDLATALAQPRVVRPGDTIWLRGGTYRGFFVSTLTGAPGAPITVRQYPGERAVLDNVTTPSTGPLWVTGAWATYWGFEVTDSDPNRAVGSGRDSLFGIDVRGPNNKFINLIVHDSGGGIGFWVGATNSTIYGCIIFYNGTSGYAHGIYTQNLTGSAKYITDNILFQSAGYNLHAYSSSANELYNIQMEGNIVFQSGELIGDYSGNLLNGGWGTTSNNAVIRNNYGYYSNRFSASGIDNVHVDGYNTIIQNNYFANGTAWIYSSGRGHTITGNTFYGSIAGFTQADYPSNTYLSSRPTGVRVFVRPNQYEPGRAHIAVYNWDLLDAVNVDVSGTLRVGARYEVRNAQDYFGPPVLSGTYDGRPLKLPMKHLRVAAPVGNAPISPSTTGPEFAAFVLISR